MDYQEIEIKVQSQLSVKNLQTQPTLKNQRLVPVSYTHLGFDAANEEYVDMKKAGIVDPTKVSRSALQNAVSIASMILTTESLVTDKKEMCIRDSYKVINVSNIIFYSESVLYVLV